MGRRSPAPFRRAARRLAAEERGVAVVEAALAFPFLVLLAFGLFECGAMLRHMQHVQAGVRDAARFVARTDASAADQAAAQRLAATGAVTEGAARRVRYWGPSDVAITVRGVANARLATGLRSYRGGDEVRIVRVGTDVAYQGVGFFDAIGLRGIRIAAAHEERMVGD